MKMIFEPDDIDKKILDLLCAGVAPKDIAGKVWKSKGAVHKRMANLRKYYQVETTIQLVLKISSKNSLAE